MPDLRPVRAVPGAVAGSAYLVMRRAFVYGWVVVAVVAGFAALAIRRKGPDADVPVVVPAPA